jgi:hypothetical protein
VQQTLDDNTQLTPDAGPPADVPVPCRACGAQLQAGQDWCLSCGTAAPGRLGARPGWRTLNSVAALMLVLVTGAFVASYAALSGDAGSKAGRGAPASATPLPGQVAQVPDAPPVVAPTPAVPPVVKAPKSPRTPATVTPVTPAHVLPITPVSPPPGTGTRPGGPAPGGVTPTGTPGSGGGKKTPTRTHAGKPVTPAPTPIVIPSGALKAYDPSKRITKSGNPADAADGDKTTAWSVTTPSDGYPMQVGLLIDLGKATSVARLQLGTTTPGGRVEIYGAAGSAVPPDILDTRWEHVASRTNVDQGTAAGNVKGDGSEKINLRQGGGKFRYVLIWLTTPPKAGPTVRITEVALSG